VESPEEKGMMSTHTASKRIMLCSTEFPPDTGGIGTYMYQLARGLHHLGWDVIVVTLQQFNDEATITTFNETLPFPVIRLHSRSDYWTIHRAMRRLKPDLILGTDIPCATLCRIAALLHRIPMIALAIGSEFRQSNFPWYQLKQLTYNTCRHVVSISQFTTDKMYSTGIHPKSESLIYPGGDDELHQPDVTSDFLRARYGLQGKRVILTMGTLSPRKGQDVVIRALPEICRHTSNAHYVMAGRDHTDGDFAALVEELGLQGNVTFAGMVPDEEKSAFFNLAEVCAITSRNTQVDVEGYGIVVIEAALCRRTTIGTSDTGVQETMIDNETGLLVPSDNPSATAAAITRLLKDDALRQHLETQAYQRAKNDCTWTARVAEFDQLFRQLLTFGASS
jgi:phosphatidyl-myo-inositol dimannoside synthase